MYRNRHKCHPTYPVKDLEIYPTHLRSPQVLLRLHGKVTVYRTYRTMVTTDVTIHTHPEVRRPTPFAQDYHRHHRESENSIRTPDQLNLLPLLFQIIKILIKNVKLNTFFSLYIRINLMIHKCNSYWVYYWVYLYLTINIDR